MLSPCYLAVAMANASNWENSIKENSFIADSELELSTRNMWKYLKQKTVLIKRKPVQKTSRKCLGQNFQADFKSGYFADVIGFDASYYGGIKLGASKDFASRAILYNDDGHAKGYNKIGQRYAKIKT